MSSLLRSLRSGLKVTVRPSLRYTSYTSTQYYACSQSTCSSRITVFDSGSVTSHVVFYTEHHESGSCALLIRSNTPRSYYSSSFGFTRTK